MSPRFTVENKVGRLIEARVFRLGTLAEADEYGAAVIAQLASTNHRRAVMCADHRAAGIYPPRVADRLVELFRPNNVRFERIAILVSPANATLYMQLDRLTREARGEMRKVFQDTASALAHLASSLNAEEKARLRAFLDETRRIPASN